MAPHYLEFTNSTKGNKEMKKVERAIRLYRKVNVNETMKERHKKVMGGLSKLEAPLGLKDSEIPEVPDFGVEIRADYRTKNLKQKEFRYQEIIYGEMKVQRKEDGILWSMILK